MKTFQITILFIFLSIFQVNAQAGFVDTLSCIYSPGLFLPRIDTTYAMCNSGVNSNFNIEIEPTLNNTWQFGKTYKFGIASERDTSCAIITDTAIAYKENTISAFKMMLPKNSQWNNNFSYYLKFWHKYDTDTLQDGCWLEFSSDSGSSWYPVDSFYNVSSWGNVFSFCNLYNKNYTGIGTFDTISGGQKAWSGKSNGWVHTSLVLNFGLPIKKRTNGMPIDAVRFVFKSDSIQNNKPGWMIDTISVGYVSFLGVINEKINYNELPIYPNPSTSGLFSISYPNNYVIGTMQIYDMFGKKLVDQNLNKSIDLSNYSNGLYYYKIFFDHTLYNGILNKN